MVWEFLISHERFQSEFPPIDVCELICLSMSLILKLHSCCRWASQRQMFKFHNGRKKRTICYRSCFNSPSPTRSLTIRLAHVVTIKCLLHFLKFSSTKSNNTLFSDIQQFNKFPMIRHTHNWIQSINWNQFKPFVVFVVRCFYFPSTNLFSAKMLSSFWHKVNKHLTKFFRY